MNPETPIALETVKATMIAYQELVNRAEHIARLVGCGCGHVTFGGGYLSEDSDAKMVFEWETPVGMRHYCGKYQQGRLPLRYLWMADAEIVAIVSKEQA